MVLEAGWLLAGAEELLLGPEGREPASKKETAQYCPCAGASYRQQPHLLLTTAAVREGCKTAGKARSPPDSCSSTIMDFHFKLPDFPTQTQSMSCC